MKRFILFSLSAAATLTLGSVAQAQTYPNSETSNVRPNAEGMAPGVYGERDPDLTGGIISPNDESPNNRVMPGVGALQYESARDEEPGVYLDTDLEQTGGVISPNSESPNNRQVPGQGAIDGDADTEPGVYLDDDLDQTGGVISPNSESPNNRQVPGQGVGEDGMTDYNESGSPYGDSVDRNSDRMNYPNQSEGMNDEPGVYLDNDTAPTEGIISPNSESPNNRQVPGQGAVDDGMMNDDSGVYLDNDTAPTEGIISPNSESPNNRQVPGQGATEDGMTNDEPGVYLDDDTDQVDGIISPNSESPNNVQSPGSGTAR